MQQPLGQSFPHTQYLPKRSEYWMPTSNYPPDRRHSKLSKQPLSESRLDTSLDSTDKVNNKQRPQIQPVLDLQDKHHYCQRVYPVATFQKGLIRSIQL